SLAYVMFLIRVAFWLGLVFFFFQAEDGIRDFHVTGVQTCALPILADRAFLSVRRHLQPVAGSNGVHRELLAVVVGLALQSIQARSEERRVGKECRGRRFPDV